MARLRGAGDRTWVLPERCILGRSRACSIRLRSSEVSGEHASLRWIGGAWELQDLHSRNGTFVAGRKLAPGERVPVLAGAVLGFGRPDGHVLIDDAAPQPFAQPLSDDGCAAVEAQGGFIALPDASAPEILVYATDRGWSIERAGEVREVDDGETIRLAAGAWRLHLPESLSQTQQATASAPAVRELKLQFRTSRNEEYVELHALHHGRVLDLKARAHHYPALLLARARLADAHLPTDQQGWIQQELLLESLRTDARRLHIDVYRLRQQIAEVGVREAAQIIERRSGVGQLRIGTGDLEIVSLDP